MLAASELILNSDQSIYHLHLLPEDIADTILLVGDPGRVAQVSAFFDTIELQKQNREFVTHTGYYKNKRITALSTGIGTDNIDIVINELDALANIDLKSKSIKTSKRQLQFIRIGTSGSIQKEIPIDNFVLSSSAIGLDGMLYYYKNTEEHFNTTLRDEFMAHCHWPNDLPLPYAVGADPILSARLSEKCIKGITLTAPGFYGSQARSLRIPVAYQQLVNLYIDFQYQGERISNFEMETSALYGLSKLLGHRACTLCAIIANRANKTFTQDYKNTLSKLILYTLERLTNQ